MRFEFALTSGELNRRECERRAHSTTQTSCPTKGSKPTQVGTNSKIPTISRVWHNGVSNKTGEPHLHSLDVRLVVSTFLRWGLTLWTLAIRP